MSITQTRAASQLRGWLDGLEALLAIRSNELHAAGHGAGAAEVLAASGRISASEARLRDRRAKALAAAPSFGDALGAGVVAAGHADALANATGRLDDDARSAFLAKEAELIEHAKLCTVDEFARRCRNLADRVVADQGVSRSERQRRDTSLRTKIDHHTGMYKLFGEFHPELGNQIFSMLNIEVDALMKRAPDTGERVDRNRLRAEALAKLTLGGHQAVRPARAELSVLIDWDTLQHGLHEHAVCEFGDGTQIPPELARRLACEAEITPIVLNGDRVPIDMGRATRLATKDQRKALRAMYPTCAFSGCDVVFDRCEIHHVIEWDTHTGPSDLDNLLPLCLHDHHLVHEGGWRIELEPDRTLDIWQPGGTHHATCHPSGHRRSEPGRQPNHNPPDHLAA